MAEIEITGLRALMAWAGPAGDGIARRTQTVGGTRVPWPEPASDGLEPATERVVVALRSGPLQSAELAALMGVTRNTIRAHITKARRAGHQIETYDSYFVLLREPGGVRLCPGCGCQMYSRNADKTCAACAPRLRGQRNGKLR
jgi:biotin operon repressor